MNLYDVTFLCTHYLDELSESARDALSSALEYKDLNQFDYIVQTQKDDLIDPDVLEDMFLQSFSALGLLDPSPDDVCDDIEVIDDLSVIESQFCEQLPPVSHQMAITMMTLDLVLARLVKKPSHCQRHCQLSRSTPCLLTHS